MSTIKKFNPPRGGVGYQRRRRGEGGRDIAGHAWRYLERLTDDGVVGRETEYGRAGRPQVRYVWRPAR